MKRYKAVTSASMSPTSPEFRRKHCLKHVRNGCSDLMDQLYDLYQCMDDSELRDSGLYQLEEDLTEYMMALDNLLEAYK